jgi:hypothetical protein
LDARHVSCIQWRGGDGRRTGGGRRRMDGRSRRGGRGQGGVNKAGCVRRAQPTWDGISQQPAASSQQPAASSHHRGLRCVVEPPAAEVVLGVDAAGVLPGSGRDLFERDLLRHIQLPLVNDGGQRCQCRWRVSVWEGLVAGGGGFLHFACCPSTRLRHWVRLHKRGPMHARRVSGASTSIRAKHETQARGRHACRLWTWPCPCPCVPCRCSLAQTSRAEARSALHSSCLGGRGGARFEVRGNWGGFKSTSLRRRTPASDLPIFQKPAGVEPTTADLQE